MGGVVSGIVGGIGGLISGGKASDAAAAQAQANREAALRASQMAQFRPIGLRTGFGSSNFTVDDLGRVTEAGYSLSPELEALRNRFIRGAAGVPRAMTSQDPQFFDKAANIKQGVGPTGEQIQVPLTGTTTSTQPYEYTPEQFQNLLIPQLSTGVSSLFNLGQGYLAESPQEAAQRFVNQQQGLLAPSRAAEFGRINARNYATGRGGIGINTGTGGAPSNPALQAYYNSLARQDLELAARGQEAGMEQTRFGAGLLTGATELGRQIPSIYSSSFLPISTQLELARSVESMGQQPFLMSQELARLQSGANTPAAQMYQGGMNAAAANQFRADSYSPLGSFLSGGGSGAISGLFSGFGGGSRSSPWFAQGGSEGSLTWRD
jgi:hypothetical protein